MKKACNKCGDVLPVEEGFYRDSKAPDGRQRTCRTCTLERNYRWNDENPEKRRAGRRRDREKNPERLRASKELNRAQHQAGSRAWHESHRAEGKAHSAVRSALKRGELQRPSECEDCGKPQRLHAHHDDYSKPLEVRWLCSVCHRATHGQLAGRDAA